MIDVEQTLTDSNTLRLDLLNQGTHYHPCESNFAEFKISPINFYVFVGLLLHLSYVGLTFFTILYPLLRGCWHYINFG